MSNTNTVDTKKPRTIAQLAREAYIVQDACNLSGVLLGAARAVLELREIASAEGKSWEWVDHHPVMCLWADKIAHLTGTQRLGTDSVMDAYNVIHKLMETSEPAKEVE